MLNRNQENVSAPFQKMLIFNVLAYLSVKTFLCEGYVVE